MKAQLSLYSEHAEMRIVNVASVPHRSPFRYPGGKTWFVPTARCWLRSFNRRPQLLLEPFAGGGIVGLTAAFERLAEHVALVEKDDGVAAVWQTILSSDHSWLIAQVRRFDVTEENVRTLLDRVCKSPRWIAFQTIVRNRTQHGGILAPGASLIRFGENGKGIRSRWYPETLCKRIKAIHDLRDRITFVHGDGLEAIRQHARCSRAAIFIDPPYTASGKSAGRRLYTHHCLDHEALFGAASKVRGDFIMTYDIAPEIETLAKRHRLQVRHVAMKNTHHARMNELVIGRDLSWLP